MKALVESVLLERNNNKNYKIKTVLSDWAYDSNTNFKYLLQKKRIRSEIKVRNNSPSYLYRKNNNIRNKEKLNCKQETFSNGKRKEKKA